METTFMALEELTILGVILKKSETLINVDVSRLRRLGYCLLFDGVRPIFCKIEDLFYVTDPILYLSNIIPVSTLQSYSILKLKQEFASGK
jgi:hypothetical protein